MKTKAPCISIIILNWNGRRWLSECLESIHRQTCQYHHEIIFVDNCSADGSVDFVRGRYPEVKIVQNDGNYGYARGNNIGALRAQGRYLLFLNTDTKLRADCLEQIERHIVRPGSVSAGVYALKLFSYDGTRDLYPNNIWMSIDIFGYPFPDKKIFYADGAALLIDRALFQQLGGFDERHFMFAEDVDLCWRARLLGYAIEGISDAVVYHAIAGSSFPCGKNKGAYTTSVFKRYLAERNAMRNMLKNYGMVTLLWVLPLFLFSYLFEILFCLLLLRFAVIGRVYGKALVYNIANAKDTCRARRDIQRTRVITDRELFRSITFRMSKLEFLAKVGIPSLAR